jgi:integrase
MSVVRLKYVNSYRDRHGKQRHYFRKGAVKEPLLGLPGSKIFMDEYKRLLAVHAPARAAKRNNAESGTLSWVIEQYKAKSKKWAKAKPSSREVYERRFQYLNENYGAADFASFDEKGIRSIRNKLTDKPSIADKTVQMIGRLWRFAKEHLEMDLGSNPTGEVSAIHTEKEAHKAWPPELCAAFEKHSNPRVVRAYYLLRFTGQRRSDVTRMKASQYSGKAVQLYQVKTGTFVWMPTHLTLREHLTATGIVGEYLLSHDGEPYTSSGLSNLIGKTVDALGFPGYSAHGLRHLAGAALAESGASVHEIMSILGHLTEQQAMEYTRQANRKKMAAHGMKKWTENRTDDEATD